MTIQCTVQYYGETREGQQYEENINIIIKIFSKYLSTAMHHIQYYIIHSFGKCSENLHYVTNWKIYNIIHRVGRGDKFSVLSEGFKLIDIFLELIFGTVWVFRFSVHIHNTYMQGTVGQAVCSFSWMQGEYWIIWMLGCRARVRRRKKWRRPRLTSWYSFNILKRRVMYGFNFGIYAQLANHWSICGNDTATNIKRLN